MGRNSVVVSRHENPSTHKLGNNLGAAPDLVAERNLEPAGHRQIHIDTRAKTDEAVTRSAHDTLAGRDVTQYTPRNQTGNLNHDHVFAVVGANPQGIAVLLAWRL